MIGMMYLVLTAMLALQVSSAIIEKFILLNNSLELSSGAANKINQETVLKIKAAVEKAGNRSADVAVIKQAEEVRKFTADITNQINALKQEIINKAGGGFNEEGGIKNPQEEAKVAELMIAQGKRGKAYGLKQTLNAYTAQLNQLSPNKFQMLAMDGREDPSVKGNKDQRNKDFAELNFESTPVAAALAVLSQKQTDIRRMEGEVLNYLASKVGAADVKFDRVLAMVSADAKTVVAGTKFKGQMFIAASASGITPRMSLNGSPVKVENGVGMIEFTAQGGGYNAEGVVRKELQARITIPTPSGRDTTYTMNQEYFVVKPSYQIETGTLPPLYLGCANKLSIQSPALGPLWAPSFSTDGGEIIQSGQKGKFTIVPNKAQLNITVSNAGNVLGSEPFRVNKVPKPSLEVRVNGAVFDERKGAPASGARSIQVIAVPDESFKNFSPEDAKFRVSQVEVSLARGNRRIGGVTLNGGGGSISSLAQQAQPGDRYVISILKVERQNFKGAVNEVEMGNQYRQVTLY
ncbi:gliding motility protein GldM [Dyadobacter sp. CY351]|uniref:Gliding motility protein GldM n=2 Tax=Spirosomataceae TaxID=2896860 RepID=A0ABY4XTA2_9BACT|nr:gliding motility protein GldM [Dyadobacter sp. CY327]MCF2493552.1 gliding motility protein GldM [Dyadobacter chenhuakuii]MCF2519214.1 gliding motility protein GldM [Dyadobacter sp. CY351]USJ33622.1 gliding motility protein GldM [Dyadobacter chenhuakuii]